MAKYVSIGGKRIPFATYLAEQEKKEKKQSDKVEVKKETSTVKEETVKNVKKTSKPKSKKKEG